jgi:hypothetical protein
VQRVSGAYDYGISFVCRYRNAANYYLLAFLSNGGHNIVRYRNGKPTFLSRRQGTAEATEGPKKLAARCLGVEPTILSLSVDGRTLGRAEDRDDIPSGTAGIRLGSSESRVTCRFDDIVFR